MSLPVATAPGTDGRFFLTQSDDSVYTLPASFTPDTLTPGTPADEVGRAPGATTWIRFGPGGREPQALRFKGRLFGSTAHTDLDALRSAARDAVSIAYRGPPDGEWVYLSTGFWVQLAAGKTITLHRGDVNARERQYRDYDVEIVLLPDSPGRFY